MLNLVVVLAGFFLLITGQYPRAIFDLLVGISRWLYRVLTYLACMHDKYPPFRLDLGPYEPSNAVVAPRIHSDTRAPTPAHNHVVAVR